MLDHEEGEALLATLGPVDRAGLDDMVEVFIRKELRCDRAGSLAYAANAFEARSVELPEAKRLLVRRFAAALRERSARAQRH
jgi:hypothetical protein